MSLKCFLVLPLLVGSAFADADGGYAAPAAAAPSYSAPSPSYQAAAPSYSAPAPAYQAAAPSYSAPSGGYAAPTGGYAAPTGDASYAAPTGYDSGYDYNSYGAVEEPGFDLGTIAIIAAIAAAIIIAIILAKLVAPFLASIAVVALGLFPMALDLKAPIVNAILAPFSLTLCNPAGPTVFPAPGRSLGEDLGVDPFIAELVAGVYNSFIDNVKGKKKYLSF